MEAGYSVQEAAQLTGLAPVLLRAWETRYRAVVPERSDGKQRRYSEDQLHRLRLLAEAVEQGERIGRIANLPDVDIENLLVRRGGDDRAVLHEVTEEALYHINRIEGRALDGIFTRLGREMGTLKMIDEFASPLLIKLGEGWRNSNWKIQHEHLATEVLKNYIINRVNEIVEPPAAPAFLSVTVPGQRHEIGALASALTASIAGFRSYYLGPDLPVYEIEDLVKNMDIRVLSISAVFPGNIGAVRQELEDLYRRLPDSCRMVIGGSSAILLDIKGAERAPMSLVEFKRFLKVFLDT